MSEHVKHLIALAAVTAAVLAGAGPASALNNVTVSAGGATAGSATASQFAFNTARKTISCRTTTSSATYISGTFTNILLPFTVSNTVALSFSTCIVTGGLVTTVRCTATAALAVTGITTTPSRVTPISLTSIACVASVTPSCTVNIGGGVVGDHNDAFRQITVSTSGQTLAATGSTDGSGRPCFALPNDASVTLTSSTGTAVVYTESPGQSINVT